MHLTRPQEVYEPLWDEILHLAEAAGFGIRGIWIADVAQQGQSGVLNEDKLGNDRESEIRGLLFRQALTWSSLVVRPSS